MCQSANSRKATDFIPRFNIFILLILSYIFIIVYPIADMGLVVENALLISPPSHCHYTNAPHHIHPSATNRITK